MWKSLRQLAIVTSVLTCVVALATTFTQTFDMTSNWVQAEMIPVVARTLVEGSELVYVSDYFSFVGRDEAGAVAFAIDNNRGRDGATYQAEHFVTLHAQNAGWSDLPGTGPYDNNKKLLLEIPDSKHYSFTGSAVTGTVIRGKTADLSLNIDPIRVRTANAGEKTLYAMGSANAELKWNGRTLKGRVLHEYLIMKDMNRLSRKMWSLLFGSFQFSGLYLMSPDGRDVYVQGSQGPSKPPFGELPSSFAFVANADDITFTSKSLTMNVTQTEWGKGLYRWPTAWEINWEARESNLFALRAKEVAHKTFKTWILGGFAMGIVEGELIERGQSTPVYGFSEVIK